MGTRCRGEGIVGWDVVEWTGAKNTFELALEQLKIFIIKRI